MGQRMNDWTEEATWIQVVLHTELEATGALHEPYRALHGEVETSGVYRIVDKELAITGPHLALYV